MNSDKIICSKNNIILKRLLDNTFSIDLQICNNNSFDMKSIINYKLFNLIGIVNKDIIEKSEIVNQVSDKEIDILYIFKRFGADLGISKKYCFLNTIIEYIDDNQITIQSKSIPYIENIKESPIICTDAKLYVTNLNKSNINIHYEFNINIDEEIPTFMQNMLGLLMKKILNNLKLFIENININTPDINNINN